jgi:release factor glutamine methyltransferase
VKRYFHTVLSILIAIIVDVFHRILWKFITLRGYLIHGVFVPFYFISSKLVLDTVKAVVKVLNAKNVCEIGSGSGYILIELIKHHRDVYGVAIDVAEKAVNVMKINAKIHSVFDLIDIVQCYSGECLRTSLFDLCYSNPPYLPCPESISENLCSGINERIFKEIFLNLLRVSKKSALISASTLTLYMNLISKYSIAKLLSKKFTGLDTVEVYIIVKKY